MIGTSDGQSYNTKWDQYSEQLFGPVTKNEPRLQEQSKGSPSTSEENKRTVASGNAERSSYSEAPKGSGRPSSEDPRGMSEHIQSEAKRLGMDPNVAMGVAKSEGLRNPIGDHGMSHGAFQLYTGGGLGNDFKAKTGLDPSDPKNEKEGITFALEHAREHGWHAFHGAKRVGISQWAGIPGEHVDNDHHVPLAASALTDGSGRIAVDHRTQDSDLGLKGFSAFAAVGEHERAELKHMIDLVDTGMDPQEAYKESHDNVANVREKAHVKAEAARLGYEGDPEEFYRRYQKFWEDAAVKAKEPTDRPIHPAAHTTKYKLDPKSGRFKVAGDVVQFPGDPMDALRNMDLAHNHPELLQRGLIFNEQTGQWEDLKAKVLPMTPKTK